MHGPDDPAGGTTSDAASDDAGSSRRDELAREDPWLTEHGGYYLLRYDQADDAVSALLERAFREITGREAAELPPLSEGVDPDALDTLFSPDRAHAPPNGSIHFDFHGYEVSIHSDGEILIAPKHGGPGGQ